MYHAVQVAASDRSPKTTTRQMLGHFRKAKVPPKRIVKEFPVTADAHVPVGAFEVPFPPSQHSIGVYRNDTICHSFCAGTVCGRGGKLVSLVFYKLEYTLTRELQYRKGIPRRNETMGIPRSRSQSWCLHLP